MPKKQPEEHMEGSMEELMKESEEPCECMCSKKARVKRPKKERTPEQIEADKERMKKVREAKAKK